MKIRARWSHDRKCWKVSRNMVLVACDVCDGPAIAKMHGAKVYCERCGIDPQDRRRNMIGRAHAAVQSAIRRGELQHPTAFKCEDCDKQAECYDHRDYDRPLEVAPVCRGCNNRRSHAVQVDHLTRIRRASVQPAQVAP